MKTDRTFHPASGVFFRGETEGEFAAGLGHSWVVVVWFLWVGGSRYKPTSPATRRKTSSSSAVAAAQRSEFQISTRL